MGGWIILRTSIKQRIFFVFLREKKRKKKEILRYYHALARPNFTILDEIDNYDNAVYTSAIILLVHVSNVDEIMKLSFIHNLGLYGILTDNSTVVLPIITIIHWPCEQVSSQLLSVVCHCYRHQFFNYSLCENSDRGIIRNLMQNQEKVEKKEKGG